MTDVERWPAWLRWVLALPAALMSIVLVSFPIHWVVMLVTAGENEDSGLSLGDLPPETLERCAQALFAPLAAILVFAYLVPRYRLYAAAILGVGWAVLTGVAPTVAAQSGNYSGAAWIEFAAVGILGSCGTLAALYRVYDHEVNGADLFA